MKVLVVDDDPDIRFLFTEVLTRAGHEVVGEATNGEQAVAIATELAEVDLVLLDVLMPVMDGIAALPLLREVVAPTTRIVFVTALLGSNIVAKENRLGLLGSETAPDAIIAKTALLESAQILRDVVAPEDK